MGEMTPSSTDCCCKSLSDLAVVPMGGDGLDERVFAPLDRIVAHGGDQWWLYVSGCQVCSQSWMIAQDERIYDNYYLRRLSPSVCREIVDEAHWPDEFLTYEKVLRLGRTMSRSVTFLDPSSPALVCTAEDLRRERPRISVEEVAYLLAIPVSDAADLTCGMCVDRARQLCRG
jgi:hypothetical protein